MTIEMPASAPFVWPSPPEDFKPWDKDMHETAVKEREAERKAVGPDAKRNPKGDGKTLRQQAEELLSGKKAWRPGWVDWDVTGRVRGDVGAQVEI